MRRTLSIALALAAGCGAPDAGPARAPEPAVFIPVADPAPECPPILDDPPLAPQRAPAPRDVGPLVDLSVLVRAEAPKRAPGARRKKVDLGRLALRIRPPHPGAALDVSRLAMPPEIPRADLPDPLRALWDRDLRTRDELRQAQVRRARAEQKRDQCEGSQCVQRACLVAGVRELSDRIQRARDRRAAERRELVTALRQHVASLGEKAPAGALLALAATVDATARDETDEGPLILASGLAETLGLYKRAAALAGPASDAGWYAAYQLGAALEDTGLREKARLTYATLAQASPPGPRTAEAAYRQAGLESDPGRAADAYQRAAAAAAAGTPIRTIARYQWARSALQADRLADAVGAATAVCSDAVAADPGESVDLLTEAAQVTAEGLGRLLFLRPGQALPRVPAAAFAPIAAHAAGDALHRLDLAAAVAAWEAILVHAPVSPEAREAAAGLAAVYARSGAPDRAAALLSRAGGPGPPPRAPALPPVPVTEQDRKQDLATRLTALARDCAQTHPADDREVELVVSFEAGAPAPFKVRAASSVELAGCLAQRGPAYLVDAPADLQGTLLLTIGL